MRFVSIFLLANLLSFTPAVFAEVPAKSKPADSPAVMALSSKLDAVAKDQKLILQQLADIKQELLIIKARATH